jgi:alkylation response protein AidB-like acyl-CoA dehydrogenase
MVWLSLANPTGAIKYCLPENTQEGYMNLEHLLTEEQRQIRKTIREFTQKEILPNIKKLEVDYSFVEKVLQKLVDMGIQSAGYPAEYGGGGGIPNMTVNIISEELAKGDPGMSSVIGVNGGMMLQPAIMANNKVVLDRFAPLFLSGKLAYSCLAMTDEATGCDSENPLLHGAGIKTIAKLQGDEWVINGAKAWPTNGGLAEFYLTVCTTDPSKGDEGVALIYVPKDAEGLSFGKPEKKMGFKTCVNSAIYYDNVRVPREYRAAGPGIDGEVFKAITVGSQVGAATLCLGIAERAFEIVLDYTGSRMGGFKPVRQHSMVAGILADMAIGIEMMKAGVCNLGLMFDHPEQYGPPTAPELMAKAAAVRVFCADTTIELVGKGAELLGSMSISEDFPYEKCLRDARVAQMPFGGQQINRYRVARGYYELKNWA